MTITDNVEKENIPVKGNRKSKRRREVIYPILLECAEKCRGEFWKQFYEDIATGKCPKGIFITNGTIQTVAKRNGFAYSISDKSPTVIIKELHYLLTTHTNICSKKDNDKKRKIYERIEEELESYKNGKWSSIKKKNIKLMLIINYCLRLKRKYNLDWDMAISAFATILQAFESHTHSSSDVVYKEGKIISINDIEFNDGSIINTRENDQLDAQENTKTFLQDMWPVFVQQYWKTTH